MKITAPENLTKAEQLDWLVKNKAQLIDQKKADIKHADGVPMVDLPGTPEPAKKKAAAEPEKTQLSGLLVINTTNIMDSHNDVHLPGIWAKSLKENKNIKHLQEHRLEFDKIIADGQDLKAYTKTYNWQELGFDWPGSTQALIFNSTIRKARNEYMFEQYAAGYVTNHSVGMRYIKITLAVNNPKYEEEFAVWEKYIGSIVNQAQAEDVGHFWAVTEAKVNEGSAVPIGSNIATPTISIKEPTLVGELYKSLVSKPGQPLAAQQADALNKFLNNIKL